MTPTARIAARFDAADGYEQAARIQRIAAMELARRISCQHGREAPVRILEIGCGTGLLTRELRRLFPHAHITATDIAPRMLERLAAQMPGDKRLSLHVMDGETPDLPGPFDLICSSLAMQWFHNRRAALLSLATLLLPGDRWLWPRWRPEALPDGGQPTRMQAWPAPCRIIPHPIRYRANGPQWAQDYGRLQKLLIRPPPRWLLCVNSGL